MRIDLGVVQLDRLGDRLHDRGLAGLRRRHDDAALALADRRHEIDDAGGHVRRVARVLERQALVGEQRREVLEVRTTLGQFRIAAVDRVHLEQARVLLVAAGRADLAGDVVALAQAVLTCETQRDVGVLLARQVPLDAQEAVALVADVEVAPDVDGVGDDDLGHQIVALEQLGVLALRALLAAAALAAATPAAIPLALLVGRLAAFVAVPVLTAVVAVAVLTATAVVAVVVVARAVAVLTAVARGPASAVVDRCSCRRSGRAARRRRWWRWSVAPEALDSPSSAAESPCSSKAISQSASGSPSAPTGTGAVGTGVLDVDGAVDDGALDAGAIGAVAVGDGAGVVIDVAGAPLVEGRSAPPSRSAPSCSPPSCSTVGVDDPAGDPAPLATGALDVGVLDDGAPERPADGPEPVVSRILSMISPFFRRALALTPSALAISRRVSLSFDSRIDCSSAAAATGVPLFSRPCGVTRRVMEFQERVADRCRPKIDPLNRIRTRPRTRGAARMTEQLARYRLSTVRCNVSDRPAVR